MVRLAALGGAALLACGAAAGAGASAAPGLVPRLVVTSFRAEVRSARGVERIAWQAPERFAARPEAGEPLFGRIAERDGTLVYRFAPGSPASVFRRTYAARPDGFSELERIRGSTEFLLARARAGLPTFRTVLVAGRPLLSAAVSLHANDCAALPRGREDVWVDRSTLLPVRTVERRGTAILQQLRLTYSGLNRRLPSDEFAPPQVGKGAYRRDDGFRRTPPREAARRLPYVPSLPAAVPAGFSLAVSGWAPRSGVTGAEGSNPRYRSLFGAVYRRGFERIDVTQRLAGASGWLNDPFGGECVFQFTERARIGASRGWFGAGPRTVPHLYWRSGHVLHTVSGPFPKRDLLAIARSLAPVQ